uniref:Uncharacterized protein n=2 Tax=Oryza sativa subsp. japonica TaxID=39947 RepID=Q5Z523_ORYSJ|nr:hypothetical protein [Oryza sativa Japonica Group]
MASGERRRAAQRGGGERRVEQRGGRWLTVSRSRPSTRINDLVMDRRRLAGLATTAAAVVTFANPHSSADASALAGNDGASPSHIAFLSLSQDSLSPAGRMGQRPKKPGEAPRDHLGADA